MLVGHSHVARGLLFMSINLSHKDDLIPIDLIHRKAIHVTRHGHIEWSFGGMWVSVVDVVAENFVVEGVEGKNTLLNVSRIWVSMLEGWMLWKARSSI
jgi:hypothetical protein